MIHQARSISERHLYSTLQTFGMFIYSRRDSVSRPRSTAKLLFTCTSAELLLFFQSVQEQTKRQVSDGLSLEMEFFFFQIFTFRLIGRLGNISSDHKALHTNNIFIHTEYSLLTAARLTYNSPNQRVWSLMESLYVYEKGCRA